MTGYILIRLMFVGLLVGVGNAQNNNSSSCSNLTSIVTAAVTSVVASDPRMGASLLRLHFHDCFVNGCDGSVLLDDTANFTGEKRAGPNANSLRGFEVIDTIKTQVEAACPGIVSCADILALAAREGVVALLGPSWNVALGRNDSRTASQNAANTQIPGPGLNLTALLSSFSTKGFTLNETVALSGAHTIGQARCTTFRARLYSDSNINMTFANATQQSCPRVGLDGSLSPLDNSPASFDNDYYTKLMSLSGLLHSDQELFNNGSADAQVRIYASNSGQFRTDFASAMVKMSNLGPPTGAAAGEIRRNCRSINS